MTNRASIPSRLPLLLLLVLTPGVGLAAEAPVPPGLRAGAPVQRLLQAHSGQPGTAEREPLRLREDDPVQRYENSHPPPQGVRILAEVAAGLVTSIGPGIAGGYVASSLCQAGIVGSVGGFMPCLGPALAGVLVGGGAGFSLGVWWGGELAGGDGRLLGALGGFAVSTALGASLALATQEPSVGLLVGVPVTLLGSIMGYELTQRTVGPSYRARVQPMLAFSPRGAWVGGLGGSF
ncbi:hypothetical protein KYC5002_02550 [Archangium violaceum]|uniref:hypothetical protein n=1 Tax=Archangium violaceum TaxID=83451 RepID=UPI002B299FE7|nr:hypothetical protein KYC5002_02550 [Archangium gephyra]